MLGIGSHREAGKKGTALLPVTADRTLWTPLDSPDEYSLSPELIIVQRMFMEIMIGAWELIGLFLMKH